MKKWIPVVLIATVMGIGIAGCLKDENPTPTCTPLTIAAPASEIAALQMYLDTNGIVATQDSRGFFYSIDESGSTDTARPIRCSDVSVTYLGTYLNGVAFDSTGSNTPVSFNLSGTIAGWQEAVPLMRKDAVMDLYLPPSLAYGSQPFQGIPGNSYLFFRIKLWAFN